MKKILFSAVIALTVTAPAYAASGSTSTTQGSAQANIIAPIVLTHTTGSTLSFGSFTTAGSGSVTITSAGVASASPNVNFVPDSAPSADQFTVTGGVSRSFAVTTAAGTVAYNGTTINFTPLASVASTTTDVNGKASFSVGGTLALTGT